MWISEQVLGEKDGYTMMWRYVRARDPVGWIEATLLRDLFKTVEVVRRWPPDPWDAFQKLYRACVMGQGAG
jgi:hypothetical protein